MPVHGGPLNSYPIQESEGTMPETIEPAFRRYGCAATYRGILLSPLAAAPEIRATGDRVTSRLRDNGDGAGRAVSFYTVAEARIKLVSRRIDTALALLAELAVGQDLGAASRRHPLVFTPVDAPSGSPVLTFPAACLLPDFTYLPHAGRDHEIELAFLAFPAAAGRLFTFGA